MKRVIAAIDDSAASHPVLDAALALAGMFDARVEAIHVREGDGAHVARAIATAGGVAYREVDGPVEKALIEEASVRDVVGLVLGARATPGGRRPAGHTALNVILSADKPVVVVPPEARVPREFDRVLVPLDGSSESSHAVAELIRLACRGELDVLILHVLDAASIPLFEDQPQYEMEAWIQEFLTRHCPSRTARAEVRVGVPGQEIMTVAREAGSDLIALGWSQDLGPRRAAVVTEVLQHATVAVLLLPLSPSMALEQESPGCS
jgi:nucleotide-binding universal stress UspA family protein